MTMTPDDVPAELVEIGVAAWRKSGRYFMAPCTRAVLAAVLPVHERMVREQVATEQAPWLTEILHVTQAFAMREHTGPTPQLVPWHAECALRFVPAEILDAARIARGLQDAPAQPDSEALQPHIADPDARALYERLRLALTCVIADDTEDDIRAAVARALTGGEPR